MTRTEAQEQQRRLNALFRGGWEVGYTGYEFNVQLASGRSGDSFLAVRLNTPASVDQFLAIFAPKEVP